TLVALAATPSQLLPQAYALYRQASAAAARLASLGNEAGSAAQPVARLNPVEPASDGAGGDHGATVVPAGLSLKNLEVGYAGTGRVLGGLDFDLPATGLVVVAGSSGSGKTTLLRTLLGFLPPLAGEVRLGGRPL